jgi:hypothetical protein
VTTLTAYCDRENLFDRTAHLTTSSGIGFWWRRWDEGISVTPGEWYTFEVERGSPVRLLGRATTVEREAAGARGTVMDDVAALARVEQKGHHLFMRPAVLTVFTGV